jgi:hypothetical protein
MFVYHQFQMRRLLSIFLVVSFSLGPLAATLEASNDARLPACCRRHGAHHCAMNMQTASMLAESVPGRAVLTAPSTCPAFPASIATAAAGPQALAASSAGLPALLAQHHSPAASRASARLSNLRACLSRGPPAPRSA